LYKNGLLLGAHEIPEDRSGTYTSPLLGIYGNDLITEKTPEELIPIEKVC